MKQIIELWLKKYLCCHEWQNLDTLDYLDHTNHLYVCKKCGKFKKQRI